MKGAESISNPLLNYKKYGDSTDNVIVFLHGVFGQLQDWIQEGYLQISEKLPKYSLLFLDLRGHGKSSKSHNSNDYTPEKNAEDIVNLLNHLNITNATFWQFTFLTS